MMFYALRRMGYRLCSEIETADVTFYSSMYYPGWDTNFALKLKLQMPLFTPLFFYKDITDKSLLETKRVCVAMAGSWSAAMAGRKTVKGSVRVRLAQKLVYDVYKNKSLLKFTA